jgi:hypothetical protein
MNNLNKTVKQQLNEIGLDKILTHFIEKSSADRIYAMRKRNVSDIWHYSFLKTKLKNIRSFHRVYIHNLGQEKRLP